MKTYVLTISRTFPAYHPRRGEETGFVEKIKAGEKLHTIRGNLPLWQKRIAEVQAGKAVLSLRYWEGTPRKSKQIEFARLTAEDWVWVQEVEFIASNHLIPSVAGSPIPLGDVAKNDGLSPFDFSAWFRLGKYDLLQPFVIIHFTPFRY